MCERCKKMFPDVEPVTEDDMRRILGPDFIPFTARPEEQIKELEAKLERLKQLKRIQELKDQIAQLEGK